GQSFRVPPASQTCNAPAPFPAVQPSSSLSWNSPLRHTSFLFETCEKTSYQYFSISSSGFFESSAYRPDALGLPTGQHLLRGASGKFHVIGKSSSLTIGSVKRIVVPASGALSAQMRPPWRSTIF